jgi:hypothetical protein
MTLKEAAGRCIFLQFFGCRSTTLGDSRLLHRSVFRLYEGLKKTLEGCLAMLERKGRRCRLTGGPAIVTIRDGGICMHSPLTSKLSGCEFILNQDLSAILQKSYSPLYHRAIVGRSKVSQARVISRLVIVISQASLGRPKARARIRINGLLTMIVHDCILSLGTASIVSPPITILGLVGEVAW